MKKLKKLTAAVLAVVMSAASLPSVTAEECVSVVDVLKSEGVVSCVNAGKESPAEDFEYRVNEDGESVTITGYKGNEGDVVIPGEIEGKKVTEIGYYAFWYSTLTSVEIPDSVTVIGDGAFCKCSSLYSVKIPSGVTEIKDQAFAWCSSITSMNIPNGVTSIGSDAFRDCSFTSIDIPNSVTQIGHGIRYRPLQRIRPCTEARSTARRHQQRHTDQCC